ncbi:23S rRNA (uracil(1939)-C(5))-methyltransferase RlmD [Nitrosomonas sp.]|uniref:23S rRNA (uracil(1939)-C(5))-methyltransferase RlmD n=1 Tax=Nitrosomonas sp. TaxID=42353 RepID=UPI001D63AF42|nr:23S rRNA (uracil(1939)-C(5))-methyltransferase RlmD [Nitrosomonas sp.]MBX3615686.1 23S rRNA (uracil(1939)-C(5))-methyltransferase RlmD [Nitrosomonas sp.]
MTDHFEAVIESLKLDGKGIAQHAGKPVVIEGALPGERVRYEVMKSKPRNHIGQLLECVHASPHRVTPRCQHFGYFRSACGGCSLQHLDVAAQLQLKQQVLEDALWHTAKIRPETLLPPLDGPAWGYRHRARLSVRFVRRKGIQMVGFHERIRGFVVDMQSCAVLPERISNLLGPLRELIANLAIRDRLPQIEVAVGAHATVLVVRVLEPPDDDDRAALLAFGRMHGVSMWLQPGGSQSVAPMLDEEANVLTLELPEFGITLPFMPTDFTQVNHQLNMLLVSRAIELLAPQPDEVVADFFCGLGNFTLPLATRAQQVIGLEGAATLVARAEQAARQNGLAAKTTFIARDLFKWTLDDWNQLLQTHGRIDRVLIDPPRAGALAVAETLAATPAKPRRIVYVSCNPETLARDTAILAQKGGWQLRAAGVVNMFPHTAHIESLAVFESAGLESLDS